MVITHQTSLLLSFDLIWSAGVCCFFHFNVVDDGDDGSDCAGGGGEFLPSFLCRSLPQHTLSNASSIIPCGTQRGGEALEIMLSIRNGFHPSNIFLEVQGMDPQNWMKAMGANSRPHYHFGQFAIFDKFPTVHPLSRHFSFLANFHFGSFHNLLAIHLLRSLFKSAKLPSFPRDLPPSIQFCLLDFCRENLWRRQQNNHKTTNANEHH